MVLKNTTVRLLELSKEYENRFVISGRMKAEIESPREFLIEHQGDRGKTEKVAIYTVRAEK